MIFEHAIYTTPFHALRETLTINYENSYYFALCNNIMHKFYQISTTYLNKQIYPAPDNKLLKKRATYLQIYPRAVIIISLSKLINTLFKFS